MSIIEIYRVKVDRAKVERLLEIHDQAVAEYQQQVPELLGIDLVRLDDETWLDTIRWSGPIDPEQLEAAACAPAAAEVHELTAEELGHDRAELECCRGSSVRKDLTTATRVWEADSVDSVRDYVDSALGVSSDNTYFEIDSEYAHGLPEPATTRA